MDIIPYSVQAFALICLVLFAVYRCSPFPLFLTVAYTAFFHITYLFESYSFIHQVIIQSTLASMLISITVTFGKDVRYSARFCLSMILGIINLILMYSTRHLNDGHYLAAQIMTISITYTLNIAEFYCIVRMNYGSRGNNIIKRVANWWISSVSATKSNQSRAEVHFYKIKEQD